jgi:hypothetical protein
LVFDEEERRFAREKKKEILSSNRVVRLAGGSYISGSLLLIAHGRPGEAAWKTTRTDRHTTRAGFDQLVERQMVISRAVGTWYVATKPVVVSPMPAHAVVSCTAARLRLPSCYVQWSLTATKAIEMHGGVGLGHLKETNP